MVCPSLYTPYSSSLIFAFTSSTSELYINSGLVLASFARSNAARNTSTSGSRWTVCFGPHDSARCPPVALVYASPSLAASRFAFSHSSLAFLAIVDFDSLRNESYDPNARPNTSTVFSALDL